MMDHTFSIGFTLGDCAGQSRVWISFLGFHIVHKQLRFFWKTRILVTIKKIILVSLAQSVVVSTIL